MTTENNGTKADLENAGGRFAETRSMLKKLAMAHGADTPIGHACHNLLEATENYSKEIGSDQRQNLRASIERQKTALNQLLSQAN